MHYGKQVSLFAAGIAVGSLVTKVALIFTDGKSYDTLTHTNAPVSGCSMIAPGESLSSQVGAAQLTPTSASKFQVTRDVMVRKTDHDKAMMEYQQVCPVCEGKLLGKGTPTRVEFTVYVCSPTCVAELERHPREPLTKWADIARPQAMAVRGNQSLR